MGDCRLRILVSKLLLEKDSKSTEFSSFSKVYSADTTIREVIQDDGLLLVVATATATTTIRTILSLLQDGRAKLWDCTTHPPQDITQWPLSLFSETGGLKSKTLYDAGWYPSGSLQVLPIDVEYPSIASADAYDDVQYNTKSSTTPVVAADESSLNNTNKRVRVVVQQTTATGSSNDNCTASSHPMLLPSQLLESVTRRFDGDDTVRTDHQASEAASLLRQQNKLAARQKEIQRHQRLEARIRKLQQKQQLESSSTNGNNKNKTVSDQVRRMLIKSRATGRANLQQQDRVYLHCLVDDCTTAIRSSNTTGQEEEEDLLLQEEYLYFSRQDTVGSVLSVLRSKANISTGQQCASNVEAELIVVRKQNDKQDDAGNGLYQRLPVLMRLYEAISLGYLQPVDEVMLRIYDPSKEDATTSIDHIDRTPAGKITQDNDKSPVASSDSNPTGAPSGQQPANGSSSRAETTTFDNHENESSSSADVIVNERLGQAIQVMDQSQNKGNKKNNGANNKKESAAAIKVRQMKIKSQAKGDGKRVKEMSNRFFVQLITATVTDDNDDNAGGCCTSNLSIVFCSQRDTLDRFFRDCVKATPPTAGKNDDWEWEFLTEDNNFDESSSDTKQPHQHHHFRRLDKKCSKSLAELESEGQVQNFGRLIVLFTKSSGAK